MNAWPQGVRFACTSHDARPYAAVSMYEPTEDAELNVLLAEAELPAGHWLAVPQDATGGA